eukprot:jgi/Chrzof1/8493/Cz03g13050.t1
MASQQVTSVTYWSVQVIGVGASVIGDMSSRPNWGLNELDFVFATLVVSQLQQLSHAKCHCPCVITSNMLHQQLSAYDTPSPCPVTSPGLPVASIGATENVTAVSYVWQTAYVEHAYSDISSANKGFCFVCLLLE